ncbi:MAG: SprT family zinc-dependent metalloprotease [Pontixanthobacter sp.]
MEWLNAFSQSPQIEIAGRVVPIAIRRHPTAKRLIMRVASDGSEIRVTMPRWAQSREATAFARARQGWIEAQIAAACQVSRPGHGAVLPYRGADIAVAWHGDHPRTPMLTGGQLRLGGAESGIANRVERWLRAEALRIMDGDLAQYCNAADVAKPALALSRARRRWGSCSTTGTVRMNWRLIMAPDHVRRSVVAHEAAHLVHFDHSPAFHELLARIYDGDLPAANRWLKAHGRGLYTHFG